jgi:predicted nucleotidyltransferase
MHAMNTANRLREILESHPGIRQAVVFGSVASGKANPGSDLDIAVEADRPLSAAEKMRLIADLAVATGRPIDLIDLKTAGEPLLGQILQHGQRILGSNTDYAALIRRHLFDAEDFLPYAQRMLHEREQARR